MWIPNMHMYMVSQQLRKFHQEACYPHLQLYIPTWNRKLLTHLGELEQNHLDLQYTLITHSQYIRHHAYPHHTSAQMVLLSIIYSGQFRKPPLLPCLLVPRGPMWLIFTCRVFMLEPWKLALTCRSSQLGMMTEFSCISAYTSMIQGYSRNYLILSSWGLTEIQITYAFNFFSHLNVSG